MLKRLFKRRKKKEKSHETLEEYLKLDLKSDEFIEILKEWEKDPTSHPGLEKWYKENYKDEGW